MGCSTRRRRSARARGGKGGWRSEDSRFGGIGYCGKEVKRGNHEIDEIREKKQRHRV